MYCEMKSDSLVERRSRVLGHLNWAYARARDFRAVSRVCFAGARCSLKHVMASVHSRQLRLQNTDDGVVVVSAVVQIIIIETNIGRCVVPVALIRHHAQLSSLDDDELWCVIQAKCHCTICYHNCIGSVATIRAELR